MADGTPDRPRRPRDAAATRAALLAAARAAFTRAGYDGAGMREIAAAAGVTAALAVRYFGSKERLFAEAVAGDFDLAALLDGDRAALGERLARYMVGKDPGAGALDPLLALLRSAPSDPAGALLRQAVDAGFVRPLAEWLGGPAAEERAALLAAALLGLAVARDVVGSAPLAAADPDALVALLAPALQTLVDGPSPAHAPGAP